MPFDPISLALGGSSLLAGLFGGSQKSNIDFNIKNNQDSYNQYQNFTNPNSYIYTNASKGFYNRLQSTIPSANSLLSSMAAQGINSPTIANLQRQAALKNAGQQAGNFESNLFGNFQNIGLDYLKQYYNNQQFTKTGEYQQNQANLNNSQNIFSSLANFGGGLLGYTVANNKSSDNYSYIPPTYTRY